MLFLDYFNMSLFLLQNFWNFQLDGDRRALSSSSSSMPRVAAARDIPCKLPRQQSDLNSFLWRVRRKPPAYLFGTIHVPYTRVWDWIPENSKRAFENSDQVFFELDLSDPRTVDDLARCQVLPHGQHLSDIIPMQLYHRLHKHLAYIKVVLPTWLSPEQRGRGLYADYLYRAITSGWERKRPVWVMLMVNTLTRLDVRARGTPVLDLYLAREAERLSKVTGAVERVDEQCRPLNGLNTTQVIFALNATLTHHEHIRDGKQIPPYTTEDLVQHYNCGDLTSIVLERDSQLLNPSLPPPPPPSSSQSASSSSSQSAASSSSQSAASSSLSQSSSSSSQESQRLKRGRELNVVEFANDDPNVHRRHHQQHLGDVTNIDDDVSDDDDDDDDEGRRRAQSIDSYFREELIYLRNERMAKRVMQLLEENPEKSFFFAFGAGHFIGNNTVLDIMRSKSFDIRHIKPTRNIKSKKRLREERRHEKRRGGDNEVDSGEKSRESREKSRETGGKSRESGVKSGEGDEGSWIEQHLHYSRYSDLLEQDRREMRREERRKSREELRKRREKRRRVRRRKKNRNFNDLWIRLDASSIESYFESSRAFFSPPPSDSAGTSQSSSSSSSSLLSSSPSSSLLFSSQFGKVFLATVIVATLSLRK